MSKKSISFFVVIVYLLLFIRPVYAHPGRTDSNQGHKDNNNVSGLGPYHYHCGGNPAHLHTNGVCPYGGGSAAAPKTSISVSNMPSSMNVGDSVSLIWSVSDNSSVTWESSDASILSFSNSGTMTALKEGKVIVNAKMESGSKSFTVYVKSVPAESVNLSDVPERIKVGESKTISAVVLPSNTTDKTIIWTSNNDKIATIDNGVLKGISSGKVEITAKCQNAVASFEVTVVNKGFSFAGGSAVVLTTAGSTFIFRRIKRKKLKNQSIEDNPNKEDESNIPDDPNELNEAYTDINYSGSFGENEQQYDQYE